MFQIFIMEVIIQVYILWGIITQMHTLKWVSFVVCKLDFSEAEFWNSSQFNKKGIRINNTLNDDMFISKHAPKIIKGLLIINFSSYAIWFSSLKIILFEIPFKI